MSKSANIILTVALLSSTMTALANASGVRPPQKQQQQGRLLQVDGAETYYFSEMMLEGDPSVVVLEAGPFKFEASCVTYEHTYADYLTYSTTSTSSISTRATTTLPSDDGMSDYSDFSYNYSDYSYTEYFAGLTLTYTAPVDDYLYGSPMYANYGVMVPDIIVGSYSAGESRTQIVYAGRNGGYGDDSTLQSTSGYYATINGDMTIGIHKQNVDDFPEEYDCMIAGFITVVMP